MNYKLLIILVYLITPKAFSLNGEFTFLNQDLSKAAEVGLKKIDDAMQAGPMRATYRKMLTALTDQTGRAFNTGLVIYDDNYILSVRVVYNKDAFFFSGITPGNGKESKFEKGKNFWWIDWQSDKFVGGTLYFLASKDLKTFEVLFPGFFNSRWIDKSDIRLSHSGRNDMVFDPKGSHIAAKINARQFDGNNYIVISDDIINVSAGNNYSPLTVDFSSKTYSYIDWFYKEGVKFIDADAKNYKESEHFLKYNSDDFPIIGTGSTLQDGDNAGKNSGIMPLFSFGSSHLDLGSDKYLGVGHIKIPVDDEKFSYGKGSNIQEFRARAVKDLKDNYGDRYIRHDAYNAKLNESKGYHYLIYFYLVTLDHKGIPLKMEISDAFLPIDLKQAGNKENYVFSLIFPMGIGTDLHNDNNVIISAGMGDYYATTLSIPLKEVLKLCNHDVQSLDMSKYEYHFMIFDGKGDLDIADTLPEKKDE